MEDFTGFIGFPFNSPAPLFKKYTAKGKTANRFLAEF